MKKIIFPFVLCMLAVSTFAQSEKYQKGMQASFALMDSAKTADDFTTIAANFERIGDAEKTQWLPYYWAAMSLSREGWLYFPGRGTTQTKTDDLSGSVTKLATRISALADKADALTTTNDEKSEILIIRNMAATQQMLVDPQSRYMTFGAEASQDLQKAQTLNQNNPRIYYLQGMTLYGTPKQFGGGKERAKPLFEKAVGIFKTEQAKPMMYPRWGEKEAENMVAACNMPDDAK